MQTLEKDPKLVCTQHPQKCTGLVSIEDIFQQMNICLFIYSSSDDWFARENADAFELCLSRAPLLACSHYCLDLESLLLSTTPTFQGLYILCRQV